MSSAVGVIYEKSAFGFCFLNPFVISHISMPVVVSLLSLPWRQTVAHLIVNVSQSWMAPERTLWGPRTVAWEQQHYLQRRIGKKERKEKERWEVAAQSHRLLLLLHRSILPSERMEKQGVVMFPASSRRSAGEKGIAGRGRRFPVRHSLFSHWSSV